MSPRSTLLTLLCLVLAGGAIAILALRSTEEETPPAPLGRAHLEAPAEVRATAASPPSVRVEVPPAEKPAAVPEVTAPEDEWLRVHIVVGNGGRKEEWVATPNVVVALGIGSPYGLESAATPFLATGTTDAQGVCELELRWSAVEDARTAGHRIWARVVGLGWIEQTRTARPPEVLDPGQPLEIKLIARPGYTARGVLLDADGKPTPGNISAHGVPRTGEPARGYGSVGTDGQFELHFGAEGTYDLFGVAAPERSTVAQSASTTYAGTGVLREVSIGTSSQPLDLIVRLAGAGVLRGRVVTRAGQPVAGLDVSLDPAGLLEALAAQMDHTPAPFVEEGIGGSSATVRTDDRGRFEVRGLREGLFEMFANGKRITQVPVPSDGQPLILIVDHTHLVVRVVDEAGEAWQGELADAAFRRARARAPHEWTTAAHIVVAPTNSSLLAAEWAALRPMEWVNGQRIEDGSMSFAVQPGAEFLVGLSGGPGTWQPIRVQIPELGGRTDVTLSTGAATELGTLSLTMIDAEGPLVADVVVRVEDLESGFVILSRRFRQAANEPRKMSIPAGAYRLAVEGNPMQGSGHNTPNKANAHGRFETDILINPAQVTHIAAHLPAGARVDLSLKGNIEQADRDAVKARWVWDEESSEQVESRAREAQVRLLAAGRWPREVVFRESLIRVAFRLPATMPLGWRETSELLPAGRYTLEAHMPGGRVASMPVTLVDGETLSVTLEL